jgi:ssDNA-binding Zn-finger/Zn-ribbon topoisomerase 1
MNLECPECGAPMVLRTTRKFVAKDGSPRVFYGCSRFPACKATHGAHQHDGRPFGIPADAATKVARIEAHEAFDVLWRSGAMKRTAAYRLIAKLMGLSHEDAHIGRFTREQCHELVEAIRYHKMAEAVAKKGDG